MYTINVGRVAMVPPASISIGDRAREEMGELTSLEESIKESGLISPLAVKELNDGTYFLLAGERRFTVLSKNNVTEIPVRIYPHDITELEVKSIELAENFYRKGFEYWEEDNLIAEIHALKQSIHGTKAPGPNQQGWGTRDTSELLGTNVASVSTAIKRTELRNISPDLFSKCKTQSDANKVIKKLNEAATKEILAKKIENNNSSSILNQLSKAYILRDFFDGVKEVPDNYFHLVEIDPPYAIELNKAKKSDEVSQYTESDYNEIPKDIYQIFLANLFKECYRVMAEHSWLLCWFAPEPWFEIVYQELHNTGFTTTRMCGIWTKSQGQNKRPEIHLSNSYEMFFYAWKGRPALNCPGRLNEFSVPPVHPNNKTHPTERPIGLMREIYNTFAFPGSRVFIPFLGSGNGLIAAHEMGMSAIGYEKSSGYRDSFLVKAHNRMK